MSEKTPESKDSSIKIEEVHRKRDQETQEEMEKIRKEIDGDNEERRNYNKNKEELEELKKEWSANGNLLSQEKQERLNQLEDLVYEHERKNERTSENEFLDALNEELSVMEQAGKITPEQAEEKRKAATLIETGFSKDPKYDALLFSRAGIAGEEEMIKIFNKKNAETQEGAVVSDMEQSPEKTPESKDSSIKIEEVHRKRDQETQEEMEKIRKEIDGDNEERRNYNKNKEELEELKKEWSANGNLLSQEKQERLNQLEDLVYEHERKNERTSKEKYSNKFLINQATSFEDLAKSIEKNNVSIQGSKEEFTPEMLKNVIAKIQSGEWSLDTATNSDGFRNKVAELLDSDNEKQKDNKEESKESSDEEKDIQEESSDDLLENSENEEDEEANNEKEDTVESDVEQSPEKSLEKFLEEKRKEFAKLDTEAESWVKIQKKYRKDVTKENFGEEVNEDYNRVKSEYFQTLNDLRLQRIEALNENLSPEKRKKEIEKIFIETTHLEKINLHEAKLSLSLKENPEKFQEKVKENTKKIVNWYRKLPLKQKLLIAGGLLGTGAVAGAMGGAAGMALATGAFVGVKAQRVLSGAATAVGLEGLIKRSQEKKIEKDLMKNFAENLEDKIKNRDLEIDKKILELEGNMTSERIRRYIISGTAGVLVGSGALAKAIEGISGYFDSGSGEETSVEFADEDHVIPATEADTRTAEVETKEDIHVRPATEADTRINEDFKSGRMANAASGEETSVEFADEDHVRPATEADTRTAEVETKEDIHVRPATEADTRTAEVEPKEDIHIRPATEADTRVAGAERSLFMEPKTLTAEIMPGSSVWSTTENYLKENLGNRFNDLNEGQKTHLIDQIKDKIAQNPAEFGLEGVKDIDHVQAGQTIDFSSIVREESFQKIFEASEGLSQEDIDSIVKNNEAIAEWVSQNPGESLTTEKVNEIISSNFSGETTGSVETASAEVDEKITDTGVEEKIFEVKTLSDQYGLSEDFVKETLQIVESSGLEGETKEALVQIYFENWNESVSFEKADDVLKKFLGEEYLKLRELCSGSPEISRDAGGNIVMNLDNAKGLSWNNWDVIISPQGEVTLKGPTGLDFDKEPLNRETLDRIKETLSRNTRGRS